VGRCEKSNGYESSGNIHNLPIIRETMIDPIASMAFSMASNKGVYALLLGSGISRTAEVPTGWDITLELVKRLAKIQNADCGSDPANWFKQKYGEEANYSELLDQLAKTPSERSGILREFFEPSPDEIERGAKIPTKAHKAIAGLVSNGYVKVIITTNFDHLIETALKDIGITPIVLSTSDSIDGAPPLIFNECTIIKVNGDYLDTRIRNTYSELANYEEPIDSLLDRIFDDFGLIICGWSAKWDIALRKAIERARNHRFTTYWADIVDLDEPAKRLAELRKAILIPIADADSFFSELFESVLAIEAYRKPHPLSLDISVARLKKYLVDDRYRIELYDLVNSEREQLYYNLYNGNYPVDTSKVKSPTLDDFADRIKSYEEATKTLLALMIQGCYWSEPASKALWTDCIERIVTRSDRSGSIYASLYGLQLYPALILFYGGCIASLANNNYKIFSSLLNECMIRDSSVEEPAIIGLTPYHVLEIGIAQQIPIDDMLKKRTPISNRLYNVLRYQLNVFLADDSKYQRCFDRFEYLIALIHADIRKEKGRNPWGPEGCFSWRYGRSMGYNVFDDIEAEADKDGEKWPLLKEGFFGGSLSRFKLVKSEYDRYISTLGL
jgi:hypothetical protein